MKKENTYNQDVKCDEELAGDKGQPSGEGAAHDNMAGAADGASDNVADAEADAGKAGGGGCPKNPRTTKPRYGATNTSACRRSSTISANVPCARRWI